ncbi:PAS domain-containing protein [Ferrovibrio xuzhouensis]|uniref:PAS domain-containing protein n=1 Tax=Ferrovibrio xuzhouensis TaxID=1576914 RepID=A0ABV7VAH1_9PROT
MLSRNAGSTVAAAAENPLTIGNPALAALYDLWQRKRSGRPAPSRADFDLADLRPWFGQLMLLDVIDGGRDMRYRLYGTGLVSIFGFDLTGRRVSEVADLIGTRPLEEYREVASLMMPAHVSRMSPSAREYLALDKLALPLIDDDGRVNKILGAIYLSPVESKPRNTG